MSGNQDASSTCCTAVGYCICYAAVSAAAGATAGAIGHSIMTAAGWTVESISYAQFVQAMAAGAAVLSPAGACVTLPFALKSGDGDGEQAQKSVAVVGLLDTALCGALQGMAGAGMFGLQKTGEQIGFAAATGATGSAVLSAGVGAGCCVLLCVCGGTAFCCGLNQAGDPVMLSVPKKPGDKIEAYTPTQLGIPCSSAAEIIKFYRNILNKQNSNIAPKQVDEMERDAPFEARPGLSLKAI